jgi:hypothetical protein
MSGGPTAPQPALRTAMAYHLGVGRKELAGRRWAAPHRGVRLPVGGDPEHPLQRLYAAAELLPPGAAIGGWGAAYLHGATELDGRGRSGRAEQAVPVVLPPPLLVRQRAGLVRWRSTLLAEEVVCRHGIPCTSLVRTAFDLVRRLPVREGVVALDLLARQAALPPGDVLEHAAARRGWRGVGLVRRAVPMADPRAASTGETRLRLLWLLDAGLPAPEPNAAVLDGAGRLLGVVDLLEPSVGLVAEYDGAGHRELRAHAADNAREEWLEDAGLVVVRATALDVGPERRRTVHRLLAAHRRAARRDRRRDTWTWRPCPPCPAQ